MLAQLCENWIAMHGSMVTARDPPPRHSLVLGLLSPTGVGAPPTSVWCEVLNSLASVRLPSLESPYVKTHVLALSCATSAEIVEGC